MVWANYFARCGAMSPLGKVSLLSDFGIAIAYFAIPVALLIVRRRRGIDLPYPWLFAMFAAFIVACGLTHLVHALQMPWTTFEHTLAEATAKALCALLSIGTAAALIAIMPTALRLISPRERQEELESEIKKRTAENRHLVREMNHRLGNQMQVMTSLVRIERRRAREASQIKLLGRIEGTLNDLVSSYHDEEERYKGAAATRDGVIGEAK